MRAGILPVNLVDNNDRLEPVFQSLAQDKFRLCLRTVVGIHHQKDAIDHLHDPLDFSAKIGVPGSIDNVHVITVPAKGRIFRANGNALFSLEIHGIHDPLIHLLICAKRPRLLEQLVHQGRLAVVHVRNDGDVANVLHVLRSARP